MSGKRTVLEEHSRDGFAVWREDDGSPIIRLVVRDGFGSQADRWLSRESVEFAKFGIIAASVEDLKRACVESRAPNPGRVG